jgi:hypothetical protein
MPRYIPSGRTLGSNDHDPETARGGMPEAPARSSSIPPTALVVGARCGIDNAMSGTA